MTMNELLTISTKQWRASASDQAPGAEVGHGAESSRRLASRLALAQSERPRLLLGRRTGREIVAAALVFRKPGAEAAGGTGGDDETLAGS